VTAILDEGERNTLAAELAGTSPEQAAAVFEKFPEIADYSIDYQPAWLPEQLPNNAARIQIELDE
jgi:hypothetical protein